MRGNSGGEMDAKGEVVEGEAVHGPVHCQVGVRLRLVDEEPHGVMDDAAVGVAPSWRPPRQHHTRLVQHEALNS